MCGQWPRCWCASSAVLGTGRSPLGELDEWSLELAGQRRALSRQTRWSTQVRFWLTVWIFTVKVRWPQLRSLIAVLDGLLSPGGWFLVFLWIGGDGVGHGCLGRGGGSSGRGPELKAGPSRRASHSWVTGETERAAARARGDSWKTRRTGSGRDTVGITSWICQQRWALVASSSSLGARELRWVTSTMCQRACSSVGLWRSLDRSSLTLPVYFLVLGRQELASENVMLATAQWIRLLGSQRTCLSASRVDLRTLGCVLLTTALVRPLGTKQHNRFLT